MQLVERQRALLIDVAPGTAIQSCNDEYVANRRDVVTGLNRLQLDDPFPWRDLWAWYGYYKDDYPTYQSRRDLVHERSDPLLNKLERLLGASVTDWGSANGSSDGWSSLEVRLDGMKSELDAATTHDDFQDVGRRSREIVIDLANLLFAEWMVPEGVEVPGRHDAKKRIDFFLVEAAPGDSNEALRGLVRSAYKLNQTVTHSSSISSVDAFAAAQATLLLVRVLRRLWDNWEPF